MRLRRIPHVIALAVIAGGVTACGGQNDGSPSGVERRDSAGVSIVENLSDDKPLNWGFDEILRLGGAAEGPQSFYRIDVEADALGRIYVLDGGGHRVLVFDSTGALLRTVGRQGSGPGELESPGRLAVAPDGTVGVQDWGKGSIVRWDPGGEPMPPIRLSHPMLWHLQATGNGLFGEYVIMSGMGEQRDSTRHRLVQLALDDPDTAAIAQMSMPPGHAVDLGCVRMSSMDRLFQPDLTWAALDNRFAIARGFAYELEVRDTTGALVSVVRRNVEPVPATAELAAEQVGDSMRVSFGGGRECAIPVETVVEQRGYASHVPAVRSIAATPGGGWWISRGVGPIEERRIDVFDADGVYIGTLPADAPYPSAFLSPDHLLNIQKDELDRPYVVLYRIDRQ